MRHYLVAIIGGVIILSLISFLLVIFPFSMEIVDVEFSKAKIGEKLSEYKKYDMNPDDLNYLKKLENIIVDGYNLNKNNVNLIRGLSKYFLFIFFLSGFQIVYYSLLFFRKRKELKTQQFP